MQRGARTLEDRLLQDVSPKDKTNASVQIPHLLRVGRLKSMRRGVEESKMCTFA